MRGMIRILVLVVVIALPATGQPREGDILAQVYGNHYSLMYVNPANPGVWTSLSQQVFGGSWVRMAPNNSDVVTGECYRFFQNSLVEIQPNGTRRSIAFFGGDYFSGFELDHEGRWILARQPYGTSSLFFHGVHHASGAVNTFFTCNYTWANDLAVGGEPGGPAFAVSATRCDSTKCTWGLVQHDRRGAHQWLPVSPAGWGGAIEIHPRSGDYFLAYYLETNASTARVARVSRTGRVTLLHSFPGTAARITQDDHAWISGPSHLLKYDISGNAVVTLIPAPQYHSFGTGIEVYGSRRLVCEGTGKPGTSVKVTLQSRKAGDGNRAYILACSLGRRPGMRFSSGEWLDLDVTDALFRLSASWAVPALFQNFRGVTDAGGNATARLNLPAGLPSNLGITVFVAGIILDARGVRTVTNTHGFVLN